MRWFKYTVISVGLLLLLALVVPLFIPLERFIPQLEKLATEKLGQPVQIESLHFTLLPAPALKLHGLRIGPDQQRFEAIILRPALGSLFQPVKVLRVVEVRGFRVTPQLLGLAGALAKPQGEQAQIVQVQRIQLGGMHLALENLIWGPLRADIVLKAQAVQGIEAGSEDGKFKLRLTPGEKAQALQIDAEQWQLPIKPALKFDQLTARGDLGQNTLTLPDIQGQLYGGTLQGKASIDWIRDWRVKGDLKLHQVETKEIVALLTRTLGVSGKLHAQGGYSLRAKDPAQLAASLSGNFKFEVKQGVLYGFDLAQAVKTLAQSGTRGGQTRFDALSGTLIITGKQYQLRDLYIASGVLTAQGDIKIAPNKQLSGTLLVALKGIAGLVQVPLDVSGTLSDPILLPNRAALAGAAAGTAILGPGFGTGVGSKAGQMLDKLFK